jgi:hypothetical protein
VSDPEREPGGYLLRGTPAFQPRTPWRAGPALLATLAILAAGFLTIYLIPLLHLSPFLGIPEFHGATLGSAMRLVALFQAVTVALTLLAATAWRGRLSDVLALRRTPRGWRSYAYAVLAMGCLQLVLSSLQYAFVRNDMLADLRPFVGLIRGPDWALTVAVVGLGAPLSEELLFRGFLLGALANSRLGFWGAALVSTLLWTVLHAGYTLVGLIEVSCIGLLLSWLLWRTGSLRVTIFCHALYNSLIVLVLAFVDLPH